VLTSPRTPELVLRWMNEAGVFGRFVPDFGRVVAQMQFDMYHHYTVDEHSIRAIGLLNAIEKGELKEDHPLATGIFEQIVSRRALFVAVLLHDIAKGRGGDHSVLGAEVAERLCPRLGMSPAETETVAWLVRWHLLMSATAFKRDLSDFKTILDFRRARAEPRAAAHAADPDDRRHPRGRPRRVEQLEAPVAHQPVRFGRGSPPLGPQAEGPQRAGRGQAGGSRGDPRLDRRTHGGAQEKADRALLDRRAARRARAQRPPDRCGGRSQLSIEAQVYPERGATLVTVYASDHPGLFYRIAGAIHVAGGNIIDARIHTTRDGMALDNFLVQDPLGRPFDEEARLNRIKTSIEDSLANRSRLQERLKTRPLPRPRADAFAIEPNVLIDNKASNRFTVIEVNARDRPALAVPPRERPVPVEGDDPFGACRDVWRARGRHLLPHRSDR
jgi:[protein-PII] uridylyltransferase